MGNTTGINWTSATWNPWHGCHKVSPGCAHCYMFRQKKQYGQDPDKVVRSKTMFDAPYKWRRQGKLPPGSKIFTCSWSDFFIEEADAWRPEAWSIIRQTPEYTYQILTKRPERIEVPWDFNKAWPNVWIGVSIENNAMLHRLEELLTIPAAVRFISVEPLLQDVKFDDGPLFPDHSTMGPWSLLDDIHWCIVGAESGHDRRPMKTEWAENILRQCQASKVPFWMKQMEVNGKVTDDITLFPAPLQIRQFPEAR